MKIAAVIVGGGSGVRAGGEKPKQYQPIKGKSVIWHALQAFAGHPRIALVQPVIGAGHEGLFATAAQDLSILAPVVGGSTRQQSCRAGLVALQEHEPTHVLIHDAARPFVSSALIDRVIACLADHDCALPALPVADTLKKARDGVILSTVDRSSVWSVQTPQGFSYAKILAAHREAEAAGLSHFTDDAAVAEHAGLAVALVEGDDDNRKLTTSDDIARANMAMRDDDLRVGHGTDIHAFEPGNSVTLCGVAIPHVARLKGHSDADAPMHALTDAILGAIGEGDIGTHFPPSDPQWKNAPSSIFLGHAMALLRRRGGRLCNADLTILCEAPPISPHISAMKHCLAPQLGIGVDRIAIKATTTETLGFTGRREGLLATATVLVRLPGGEA
ncbi:bifunctional 2-C-methyl-D-erythritol 4-phosphate cytidylyltransferase/2-C-methyl-D-erythritol 2,4-cyclodiphosphate synthase [soil metagenome]